MTSEARVDRDGPVFPFVGEQMQVFDEHILHDRFEFQARFIAAVEHIASQTKGQRGPLDTSRPAISSSAQDRYDMLAVWS
jgi:hypothetical protein